MAIPPPVFADRFAMAGLNGSTDATDRLEAMMSDLRVALEAQIAAGKDSALLRFTLGSAYLKDGDAALAIGHLLRAVQHDPDYSAAWALLGKAHGQSGNQPEAREAYEAGILVAERKGDLQAAKQMRVFLRRLLANAAADDPQAAG